MRRIFCARYEQYDLRLVIIPKLDFAAKHYIDPIDWQKCPISDSPIPANNSVDDIKMFVASGDTPQLDFPKYPCRRQAVERCVK